MDRSRDVLAGPLLRPCMSFEGQSTTSDARAAVFRARTLEQKRVLRPKQVPEEMEDEVRAGNGGAGDPCGGRRARDTRL